MTVTVPTPATLPPQRPAPPSVDSTRPPLRLAGYDFLNALRRTDSWFAMARGELAARYGRTLFGAAWNMLIFGAFCIVIITLFGSLQPDLEYEFGVFVVIGFLVFTLLSTTLTDAATVYTSNANWMKAVELPLGFYIYKGIARNLIIFGYNLVAAIGILWFFYDFDPHPSQLTILATVPVILLTMVAVNVILGPICARYRDLAQVVLTFSRFSLFITPIMWTADLGGIRGLIAQYNPLTHYIEIIRTPILHARVPVESWLLVGAFTAAIIMLAVPVYLLTRRRLVFWL